MNHINYINQSNHINNIYHIPSSNPVEDEYKSNLMNNLNSDNMNSYLTMNDLNGDMDCKYAQSGRKDYMRNSGKVEEQIMNMNNEKYLQWFDTIYTVCVKLDDLCCRLSGTFPHSMNIWEREGKINMNTLKSAFYKYEDMKLNLNNNDEGNNKSVMMSPNYTASNNVDSSIDDPYMKSNYMSPSIINKNDDIKIKRMKKYNMNHMDDSNISMYTKKCY